MKLNQSKGNTMIKVKKQSRPALDNYIQEKNDPFLENYLKPLSSEKIFVELAESRDCYLRGEIEDFDDALDKISAKYGL